MTEDQGKFSPSRDSAMPVVEPKTFHRDAYPFIQTVVERVGRRFGIERGITARQILEEVCAYATESFGPLAWLVLSDWGITSSMDVGTIIFELIDADILGADENDHPEDYRIDFDFSEILNPPVMSDGLCMAGKVPIID